MIRIFVSFGKKVVVLKHSDLTYFNEKRRIYFKKEGSLETVSNSLLFYFV